MGENVNSVELEALAAGRGFVDLSGWWKIAITGSEARTWLNDLLSAEITSVTPGRSIRSFLLTPTGRIRADLTVIAWEDSFLLVQDPRQPVRIDALLEPYLLSADVRIDDRTEEVSLVAVPDGEASVGRASRPSCVGPGTDVLSDSAELLAQMKARGTHEQASREALEAWRIMRGVARFPIDLTVQSLPLEAGLDQAIAFQKGCFLGQEAVAKVRNLGHPSHAVLAARAEERVEAGEPVISGGDEVGVVTSATTLDGVANAIVRVRWSSRKAELSTDSGASLQALGLASGSHPTGG